MSDVPEGPGWWQASDGQWYPPDQFGQVAGGDASASTTTSTAAPSGAVSTGVAQPADPNQPVPLAGGGFTPQPPVLCTVGDIAITGTEVITPSGRRPLQGTTWMVSNQTVTTSGIPTWAIVVAILLVWACLLGLLFLLVKEEKTSGMMQVSVQADGFYYATQVPVSNIGQVQEIENRVNYIRSIVATAV